MSLGLLRALVLNTNFGAHGIPAVVTLPNEDPVDATVNWLSNDTEQGPGGSFVRAEPRRVIALRRSEVPVVPMGTVIVVPELAGGVDKAWRVDGADRMDADHHRFVVVLDAAATADLPDA